eukprot:gene24290-30611_t
MKPIKVGLLGVGNVGSGRSQKLPIQTVFDFSRSRGPTGNPRANGKISKSSRRPIVLKEHPRLTF